MQAACPGAWESVTQLAAGLVRTTSHHFDGAVSFLEEIADEIVGVPQASAGAEPVGRLAGVGVGEEPVEIDVDDDDGSEGAAAAAAGASPAPPLLVASTDGWGGESLHQTLQDLHLAERGVPALAQSAAGEVDDGGWASDANDERFCDNGAPVSEVPAGLPLHGSQRPGALNVATFLSMQPPGVAAGVLLAPFGGGGGGGGESDELSSELESVDLDLLAARRDAGFAPASTPSLPRSARSSVCGGSDASAWELISRNSSSDFELITMPAAE
mmetsp:Transcript_5287/g.16106  ORF Transcript_5287/g.16106 Transcript_5287/m.16106 type:complete len:271 (+) Transcript_5287:176-988(+)